VWYSYAMKLSEELNKRGFVHQFTSETLEEIVDGKKRVVYHGIDPTADSAHAGNFVQWVLLKHLLNHGHKIIFLVGGGTGRIGDPKSDKERTLTDTDVIDQNVAKLAVQAKQLLGSDEIVFVNNNDWLSKVGLIDFLRDTGKHFTVNELMKKDAIASRLNSEIGLSYTEFAYPLLQAYDYLHLYRNYGCDLQTGGSDQWGSIVAGVDLVRRVEGKKVYALTQALVIDKATGKKFGKSEGNAVWLDAEKTSPYQFYQFWLNTADDSVIDYLKRFTFLSLEEIEEIEKDFTLNPGTRLAQKKLAEEVTIFVHGKDITKAVINVTGILFDEADLANINDAEKDILLTNAPVHSVELGSVLVDVLVVSGLASSKREARTFIESGAVSIGGNKVDSVELQISAEEFKNGICILRRGKKQLCVLKQL
jgi:tyrosyl-tRNA synthetase